MAAHIFCHSTDFYQLIFVSYIQRPFSRLFSVCTVYWNSANLICINVCQITLFIAKRSGTNFLKNLSRKKILVQNVVINISEYLRFNLWSILIINFLLKRFTWYFKNLMSMEWYPHFLHSRILTFTAYTFSSFPEVSTGVLLLIECLCLM